MVIPTIAAPPIQSPPPPQAADIPAVPAGNSVMGQLPFRAVPAPVSSPELYNNSKSSSQTRSPAAPQTADVASRSSSQAASARLARAGSGRVGSGFTTFFMAQVMAQGSERELETVFFKTPAEVLDVEVMEGFSLIQYMPSLAAKPDPAPVGTRAISEGAAQVQQMEMALEPSSPPSLELPTVQAPEIQAAPQRPAPVSAESVPVQPETKVAEQPIARPAPVALKTVERVEIAPVAVDVSAQLRDAIELKTPSKPEIQPQIKTDGSLVRESGVKAYTATFSRNMLNLDQVDDQPIRVTI